MNFNEAEDMLYKLKENREYDNVIEYASKLLEESVAVNNYYYQIVASYYLANIKYYNGNFDESLKIILHAIQLCQYCDTPFYLMNLYNLAGIIYGAFNDEITSIEYTLKAYYIALEHPDLGFIFIIENNLGVLFYNEGMFDNAYEYFIRGILRRNISDFSNMTARDGYNIVNLIGCCMKTNNQVELKKWYPYLEYYLAHFDEPLIHDDYLFYEIYQTYYYRDTELMEKLCDKYFIQSKKNKDVVHTLKNLNEILDLSIKLKFKSLCIKIYLEIRDIVNSYPTYIGISKLYDDRIKLNIAFGREDTFEDTLYKYYLNQKKEDEIQKSNIRKSLLTKIELEEALHRQKEIMKMNEELKKSSEIEDFTKVLNKTAFKNHVMYELNNYKDDQYMALFLIDLDKFKNINDKYGHLIGDQLLLSVSQVLKNSIRESDYIGRIGGDEFCVFMKNILSLEYIKEKAEFLLNEFKNIKIENFTSLISTSIGICVISSKKKYDKIFECADNLMYKAKKEGGDHYFMRIYK